MFALFFMILYIFKDTIGSQQIFDSFSRCSLFSQANLYSYFELLRCTELSVREAIVQTENFCHNQILGTISKSFLGNLFGYG